MKLMSLFLFLFLIYSSPISLSKSAIKQIDKAIHKTWDDENLSYNKLCISVNKLDSLGIPLQQNQVLMVKNDRSILGYVFLDQGKGRFEYFDYMVITDTSIVVKEVQVLIYRSDHGGAIGNKGWLRQFRGMDAGSSFNYGREIDAISGATLSGNSITAGVAIILGQLNVLKQEGLLD